MDEKTGVFCPNCGTEAEAHIEEVDIGVGIQKHITGYECTNCGEMCSVCNSCGQISWEDPEHFNWCPSFKEGEDE